MEQNRKEPKLWPSILSMVGLVVLAGFLYLFFTQSSDGFRSFGMWWALVGAAGLAIYGLPAAAFILLLIALLRKCRRLPKWVAGKLFLGIGLVVVLYGLGAGLLDARPKARLVRITSEAAAEATNVEVVGFNAFLANRWLFTFDASEDDVEAITSTLELEKEEGYDLKASMARDLLLSEKTSDMLQGVPDGDAARTYSRRETSGDASNWMILVYSESAKRAWLYYGYQN